MSRRQLAFNAIVLLIAVGALTVAIVAVRAEPGGATRDSFAFAGRLTPPQPGPHDFTFTFRAEGDTTRTPCAVTSANVDVRDDGTFEAPIDIGSCALFDGTDVVMDIAVDGTPITPDAALAVDGAFPIHPVPYARYADRVGVPECPPTYARGTDTNLPASVILCTRSDGDEMVRVGGTGPSAFWVDRYESSICPGDPGTLGTLPGQNTTMRACSRAGGNSVAVSWFQALAMCGNSGKRMCSNAEWQLAAQDTVSASCVLSGSVMPADPTRACRSRWGAADLVGNRYEWVAEWMPGGRSLANPNTWMPWGTDYGGDQAAYFDSNVNVGGGGGNVDGLPAAVLRGGGAGDGARAGVFNIDISAAPSYSAGFRCCVGG
jgi:formylglycine-generating enzyme required for sulfatase activity